MRDTRIEQVLARKVCLISRLVLAEVLLREWIAQGSRRDGGAVAATDAVEADGVRLFVLSERDGRCHDDDIASFGITLREQEFVCRF